MSQVQSKLPRYVLDEFKLMHYKYRTVFDLITASHMLLRRDISEGDLAMLTEYLESEPKAVQVQEFVARTRLHFRKTAAWEATPPSASVIDMLTTKQYKMVGDMLFGSSWAEESDAASLLKQYIEKQVMSGPYPVEQGARDFFIMGLAHNTLKTSKMVRHGCWVETYVTRDLQQADKCLEYCKTLAPSLPWRDLGVQNPLADWDPRAEPYAFFGFFIVLELPNEKDPERAPSFRDGHQGDTK